MKQLTSLLISVFLLAACNSRSAAPSVSPPPSSGTSTSAPSAQLSATYPLQVPAQKIENGCIQPLVGTGYPRGELYLTPAPETNILPADWQSVSGIPKRLSTKNSAYIALIRQRNGHDEFWIRAYDSSASQQASDYLIYREDTGEWRPAPVPPSWNIFLGRGSSVWAATVSSDQGSPALYQLDEGRNLFAPIMDQGHELSDGHISSKVKTDSHGFLWFIFHNRQGRSSLYSFDPGTRKAERHLPWGDYDEIEIDNSNHIYVLRQGFTLLRYDPVTGNATSVTVPRSEDEYGYPSSMYFDHESRLWVSDTIGFQIGDAGIDNEIAIKRSPVFIDYARFLSAYRWMRPWVLLESQDGRLWYLSTRGDAWFKPQTGEWCLFTTYVSNIVEDSDQNLWMMIGNLLHELTFR